MEPQSFGYWLRRKRKSFDLTRETLAGRVGCSAATIRKIEDEERRPSVQIAGRLAEIFDIPPSDRPAFLRFARGEMFSAPAEAADALPWQLPASQPRTNLPATVTSLVGRQKEIADVRAYLNRADIRLVTLVGPPGIGKTRLSIEVGRISVNDFPDGVFFVALAPIDSPDLVAATLVQTLGYLDKKSQSALNMLKDGIGDKRMLLVLDNCEHLIEAASELAAALLTACPLLKILATSRETLRIPGEWQYNLNALSVPRVDSAVDLESAVQFPALMLFAERAHAVHSGFVLTPDNLRFVAAICARLDGLPLAIELIAARIRLMAPQALLERLTDEFVLSADGMRTVTARQKTLGNAIGWSFNFLPPEEQKIFAGLGVFSGGFTLESAEATFKQPASGKTISDIITALSDKSLLQRELDAHGQVRFDMLVTIRQFALERLRQLGAETDIRNRHLAVFVDLAEQADREIHGANQITWIDRLKVEHENFRSALEWSLTCLNTQAALRLISALSWVWGLWQHNSEIRGWFEKVRALPDLKNYPLLYAQLLNHIAHSNWLAGEFQQARAVLKESCQIWQELGEEGERGLAEALCYLGMVAHSFESDYETARSFYTQSFEMYQKTRDEWGMAFAAFNLGWVYDHQDMDAAAHQFLEQSLQLFTRLGDLWGMGRASQFMGQLFLKQKNFADANRHFTRHLEIDEQLQFRPGTVIALGNLGDLHRHQGIFEPAEAYFLKSLSLCREYGLKIDRGYNLFALGMLGLQKNDYAFARQHIIGYFNSGWSVSQTLAACDLCYGLAAVAGGTGELERCAKLYGAAQALLQINDIPYTPFDRAELERHIQIARDQLGEAAFEASSDKGCTLSLEQVLKLALESAENKHPLAGGGKIIDFSF